MLHSKVLQRIRLCILMHNAYRYRNVIKMEMDKEHDFMGK